MDLGTILVAYNNSYTYKIIIKRICVYFLIQNYLFSVFLCITIKLLNIQGKNQFRDSKVQKSVTSWPWLILQNK